MNRLNKANLLRILFCVSVWNASIASTYCIIVCTFKAVSLYSTLMKNDTLCFCDMKSLSRRMVSIHINN